LIRRQFPHHRLPLSCLTEMGQKAPRVSAGDEWPFRLAGTVEE
jgi:hypothetical protein